MIWQVDKCFLTNACLCCFSHISLGPGVDGVDSKNKARAEMSLIFHSIMVCVFVCLSFMLCLSFLTHVFWFSSEMGSYLH